MKTSLPGSKPGRLLRCRRSKNERDRRSFRRCGPSSLTLQPHMKASLASGLNHHAVVQIPKRHVFQPRHQKSSADGNAVVCDLAARIAAGRRRPLVARSSAQLRQFLPNPTPNLANVTVAFCDRPACPTRSFSKEFRLLISGAPGARHKRENSSAKSGSGRRCFAAVFPNAGCPSSHVNIFCFEASK